jgi:small-conductance mechanosensitive channel
MLNFLDQHLFTLNDTKVTIGSLLVLVAIFGVIFLITRVIALVLKKASKDSANTGRSYTLLKLIRYFLYTIGIVMALQTVGVEITAFLVGSAALLVGVGLGLQHVFMDVISGFVILFEGTMKVGDIIEIDDLVARVEQIDIRTSKVMTLNGNVLILPNSKITGGILHNWSLESLESRFQINVGVAYGSDTALVRDLLTKAAKGHPSVLKHRPIRVDFLDFGDSSLDFRVLFWVKKSWDIQVFLSDIRFSIDKAFRENGVRIPFPQRDVHLFEQPKPETPTKTPTI